MTANTARANVRLGIAALSASESGAWVKSQQVEVEEGRITAYKVTLKIVFVLND